MKKRYKLETGMDTSITLEIDTAKMKPELANDINRFWCGADDVLSAADGDVVQAVARRAAGRLLSLLMDGYKESAVVEILSEQEGWPTLDCIGITVIDHEIPSLDPDCFEVEELTA